MTDIPGGIVKAALEGVPHGITETPTSQAGPSVDDVKAAYRQQQEQAARNGAIHILLTGQVGTFRPSSIEDLVRKASMISAFLLDGVVPTAAVLTEVKP